MPGDYTRLTFDPLKDRAMVLEQQGRVRLDADANEAIELLDRRLRTETRAVLAQPDVIQKLAAAGAGEPYLTTPEEFRDRIHSDHEKYGKVIKAIGARME